MYRYVRDMVRTALTEGAPIFGIAQLYFPREESLRDEFFDDPKNVPVIARDIARFVGHYDTAEMLSHVVK